MGKYLNETEYKKKASFIKIIGVALLIIGVILLVLGITLVVMGFHNMSNTVINGINSSEIGGPDHTGILSGMFNTFSLTSTGFFSIFISLVLLMVGGFLLFIGNRREIAAFNAQQVLPVEREIIDEMTPTIANSAGEIAKSVKKGLKEVEK